MPASLYNTLSPLLITPFYTHTFTCIPLPPSNTFLDHPTYFKIICYSFCSIFIMNLNSSPSHFPMHQITHHASDHELYLHQPFLPNPSPSVSCHFFFDPSQHHSGFYDHHHHLYRPNHVPDDQDYGGSSTYDEVKNKVVDSSGLKLGLWKNEDVVDDDDDEHRQSKHNNPMKWMSSKMRVMQKMKHTDQHDRAALKITSSADQKVQQPSSSTDLSSNSSSYNNNNNNSPIRVCSDCNTTKTPLWRSGPKGPKSLCNACGIRQRKARRAMAAAAAATNGAAASTSDQSSAVKNKLQHKGKLGKNGHPSQLKKRCKTAVAAAAAATTTTAAGSPPSTGKKQLGFEEFLISLSKNLACHHVFPDDEKDAAILLMALSSGLVNG